MSLFKFLAAFTICFPFLAGFVTSCARKGSKMQSMLVYISASVEIVSGIALASMFFINGCEKQTFFENTEFVDMLMVAGDIALMCIITAMALKNKKYFVIPLTVIPTLAMVYLELFALPSMDLISCPAIRIDRLAVLMVIIVTIIGGFINFYSVGYMKGYHHHHPEFKDRTNYFLPLLMVFLGAMCGLVMSSNLIWLCFFWEVTSTISFLLIGYTKTKEAVDNSFKAIWMNLLGGCALVGAIYIAVYNCGTSDLEMLLAIDSNKIQIAVALFAFAALTKSAQFPFSGWLLGAMCAPTPSSALLHSATMVKAGIYLLIRIAPAMHTNASGIMTAFVGGFTFLIASMLAISASDAKKVLAYSTISNLGLMVACCGTGTRETIFGAVMLLIFHAVSKAMLFQAVGAVENSLGSRDIEDMDGLIMRMPKLATVIIIGILGMYTAPFGMLISKWVAFQAFVDSNSIILVLMVAFGSATTMFYWTKFLSKILTMRVRTPVKDVTQKSEYISLAVHAVAVILICAFLSPIVSGYVEPMMEEMFHEGVAMFSNTELITMVILLMFMFLVPLGTYAVCRKLPERRVPAYMAGINTGDGNQFVDSFGNAKQMNMSNWYMEDVFGEKKLMAPAVWASTLFIIIMIIIVAVGGYAL